MKIFCNPTAMYAIKWNSPKVQNVKLVNILTVFDRHIMPLIAVLHHQLHETKQLVFLPQLSNISNFFICQSSDQSNTGRILTGLDRPVSGRCRPVKYRPYINRSRPAGFRPVQTGQIPAVYGPVQIGQIPAVY